MITELNDRHFSIKRFPDGKIKLCIQGLQNLAFVYFRKNGQVCSKFDSVFKNISSSYGNSVQFAVLDLTKNVKVYKMGQQTHTPIQKVPWLVFHVGGVPQMKYSQALEYNNITSWLRQALSTVSSVPQNQPAFVQPRGGGQQQRRSTMPDFTGGGPQIQFSDKRSGGNDRYTIACEENSSLTLPPDTIPKNEPWIAEQGKY